jgi:excisionase family DNA binding protein
MNRELLQLLTLGEVAEVAAVSPSTVKRAVRFGELKAIRFGRAVRFDPEDVQRWIEGRRDR